MLDNKKICVILPAYNAQHTLARTYVEIPKELVDDVILVDDKSTDDTIARARELGIYYAQHPENRGYGGNQKTCYHLALERGADIIVMLHPDYQYSPTLVPAMAAMIASNHYDIVLGSRIIGGGALKGGMPLYKYVANRFLTLAENLLLGTKLSEFHTGYRAFRREVLENLPLERCSDDFVFDNQILALAVAHGYRIGEISCPTRYLPEASSINLKRSIIYGFGVLETAILYRLHRFGLFESPLFKKW